MSAALRLSGVRKSFYGQCVLDDIRLELESGKFYLLAGPNGAGKSTLMRILMRQEVMDRGEGSVLGYSLSEDHADQNLEVAFVHEAVEYALPLSIGKLFERFSRIHPRWDARIFDECQRQFGFDLSARYESLSRGQKMQVAMSAAFAARPKLLLLDEVTSVLDARAREIVMDRLRALRDAGATIVFSTNIVTEAQHVADQLLILKGGQIPLNAPIAEVSRHFVRLKRPDKVDHPLFRHAACHSIGIDAQGVRTYLLDVREPGVSANLPRDLIDPTPVTATEAFIYFTRVSGE